MEADAGVYPSYHNDFRLLNGKLLEHYGCTDEMRKAICDSPAVIDLQEVKSSDVVEFVPYVLGDMDYEQQVIDEPLNVFSFIQIKGYIETSVDIGIMNLQHVF
ncbi:hypothetical protein [Cohnella pontilimi]|uniref:hypothetical protein n=1 Tax=Cohnella pontilimi TaxID=2564100 RepID=UPI00319E9EE1